MNTATQNSRRQEPPPQYSDDEDLEYYSGDDYSVEEYETPVKNQPQKKAVQSQPRRQQRNGRTATQEKSPAQSESKAMQPFEHIGPPETSMDGPVTYARAQRGEIPMREGNPNQKLRTAEKKSSSLDDQDGLKLKLELNLDIEVELKASIHGDLTLALL
ncbi:hypothetical protein FQN55_006950 [Onygenales sp. PD_40]|nr:hypothetical protein FQN55_006950 [Onygenales sp. PD_40]KAK2776341.1 hypothetical protein FQN52_003484 [Onygenales sp. PD_12]KAK2797069.1 hypothetical protein FQN51_008841 [Onygenales sp. PD_10]